MLDIFECMDEWGPEKIILVHDTRTGMQGMLVIDNTARGPGKGGCRMDAGMTLLDCIRLARTMTWKWAMADIFLGGAKAGIKNDPWSPFKEEIIRAYVKKIRKFLQDEYVFGNDMGFTEKDGAIALDEAEDMGTAVGTPAELGGLPYDELGITGYGVVEAAQCAAPYRGIDIGRATVSIQGFGAVGAYAAKRFEEKGAKVVAISSTEGSIYNPQSLNISELLALRERFGDKAVLKYGRGREITLGKELEVPVDILVPCAKGDVITERNMKNVKARLIVEGANFPTTEAAQRYFHQKGVLVIPDFVANAGAVIGAGKAMDSRHSCDTLDAQEVYEMVQRKMWKNVGMVLDDSKKFRRMPREVAMVISKERVRKAMELRGRIQKKRRK